MQGDDAAAAESAARADRGREHMQALNENVNSLMRQNRSQKMQIRALQAENAMMRRQLAAAGSAPQCPAGNFAISLHLFKRHLQQQCPIVFINAPYCTVINAQHIVLHVRL
jgi:16S rRNA G966 N2-methylase RsmD